MNVEEFYNKEAKTYDESRWTGLIGNYVHSQYDRLVKDSLPIIPSANYLEVGCGTGRFTVPVASRGIKLTAIDISDEMLATTKERLGSLAASVNLLRADARQTAFPSNAFDVIFSFNVINHVPEYERVISEVARVLKPGGYFVVGYPSLWSVYLPYAIVVNMTRKSIRRGVYTRWPSTPALIHQARGLGMEVECSYGMFHFPAIRNRAIERPIAALLKIAGKVTEKGVLQSFATTRILRFRKIA